MVEILIGGTIVEGAVYDWLDVKLAGDMNFEGCPASPVEIREGALARVESVGVQDGGNQAVSSDGLRKSPREEA